MWIIEDWTGKRILPDKSFTSFENGWEFIRTQFPEKDWEDLFIVELN